MRSKRQVMHKSCMASREATNHLAMQMCNTVHSLIALQNDTAMLSKILRPAGLSARHRWPHAMQPREHHMIHTQHAS